MQRQVLWWEKEDLPNRYDLEALADFDGIFIPEGIGGTALPGWQERVADRCQDLPAIAFAEPAAQKNWIALT